MKKKYFAVALSLIFALILTSCGSDVKVPAGTYALGGDSAQQSIVIEKNGTLRFVNFGENYFIDMFKVPGADSEQYDEENYEGVLNAGKGSPISYTAEKADGEVYIKTKIGDFVEIKLPYDKKTKTIQFRNQNFSKVK